MNAMQSNGEISSDGECGNVPVTRFTAELKAKWIAALRSGKYRQTKGRLRGDVGYCCLGVLSLVADVHSHSVTQIKNQYGGHLFLGGRVQNELAIMNDDGMPFAGIADHIEANIPAEE